MPIGKERFEAMGDDGEIPPPGTNAWRILEFLRENSDQAFTQSELAMRRA